MKFLIVGLGSMGKRRVRNLKEIGIKEIIGYDIREDRRKQAAELYSIKVAESYDEALKESPDTIIISTSPDAHKKYAISAIENKINFFTEVNTMHPNDMKEIIDKMEKNKVIGIPSSNLMFHPSIVKIKNILNEGKIGKILTFNFHSGSFLPDWHPWEKLEDYYVYEKETGGGRDQIMWELSWIFWLLGKPKIVSSFTRKIGPFKANIFDVYNLMIEFKNKVIANVMVDVIQRPPGRMCEIIGENGTVIWDYEERSVKVFSTSTEKWENFPESDDYKGYSIENKKLGFAIKDVGVNETYIDEIKNLMDVVLNNKKQEFTFEDEKIILDIMFKAEKSSQDGNHIEF
jgi:predicted dehydrogenase